MLSGPRAELAALKRFVLELEKRYVLPHLRVQTLFPSRAEELDVAAFAILVHGALENFVEGLALWILARVTRNWLRKRVSRSTASLLWGLSCSMDHGKDTRTVFDLIRGALDEACEMHSGVIQKNNGIASTHLRTLFTPLGVDVPSDPALMGALDTLVKMRHDWAHQYRFGAKVVKSAADAKKTVEDCLLLAEQLYRNTMALKL